MRKTLSVFIVIVTFLCFFVPNVFADDTGFDVVWPENEYLYDGNEAEIVPTPNKDHVQVEYLGTNGLAVCGTRYIDTKHLRKENSKYEIVFEFDDLDTTGTSTWINIFGADERDETGQPSGYLFWGEKNASPQLNFSINQSWTPSGRILVPSLKTKYKVNMYDNKCIVNDTNTVNNTQSMTNAISRTDWLFDVNIPDLSYQNGLSGKVYYFKIWDGDDLACDFIPVVVLKDQPKERNSNGINIVPAGTACMYDKVTEKYFLNVGTDDFIPGLKLNGETYKVLESLKSSGSQYFDTGYDATINTKWIIDYRFNYTANAHLGGGINNDVKRFCIVNDTDISGNVIFGIGDKATASTPVNTNRHIYVVDGPNKRGLIDGEVKATTSSSTVDNTRLYIFGRYDFSAHPTHTADLYSSKIFDDNSLEKNYIPVQRDSDGKVGIYDLKNNSFLLDSGDNSFTAGSYDTLTGADFCKVDKKTNAGEYIFYPFSNLANALFTGDASNFEKTWKILKIIPTVSHDTYDGYYDGQEHPVSLISVKDQENNDIDTSKYNIVYYIDETHLAETSLDNINSNNNNFKNAGTYTFYYVLNPTDTTNYETIDGSITIKLKPLPTPTPAPREGYSVPKTCVE